MSQSSLNLSRQHPHTEQFDRLETLLKNLPGMAYRCLNLDHWPMEFVSDGCYQLCGYQRHEIESQSVLWGDFTHPQDIDEVDRKVRTAAIKSEPFEVEYRIIARSGQQKWVWERGRVVDFRDDGVAILEGFITDITSQRIAEKEAREQRELLAHVDRLNTLGEMAAGIAHEINQPLTAISMYAQTGIRLMQSKKLNKNRLSEALEKLSLQAHRASAVIERMQEMTKQRESLQEVVDCESLITEVHKLAEVEAHLRDFIIILHIDSDLPSISCDPIQIQQVILNLLRNGMESMKASHCPAGSKIILQINSNKRGIRISIIDNGLGISETLAKKLYQPFTSTKESGMGLGLSISRSIISAHGGKLEFSNNNTSGATFYFTLPHASN